MSTASAPAHLSKPRQALWRTILRDFELAPAELEVLRLACEALDRADEARDLLARDGLTQVGRYGRILAHPAVAIERDARLAAARLFKQLGFKDDEADLDGAMPLKARRRPGQRTHRRRS